MKGVLVRSNVGLEAQLYIPSLEIDRKIISVCISGSGNIDLGATLKNVKASLNSNKNGYEAVKKVEVPDAIAEHIREQVKANNLLRELESQKDMYKTWFSSNFLF